MLVIETAELEGVLNTHLYLYSLHPEGLLDSVLNHYILKHRW